MIAPNPSFDTPWVAALNHLLASEPRARARLAPFAGETVALVPAPLPELRLRIAPDGRVATAPADAVPALTLRLRSDALAALARGEEHFMRSVEVVGNAQLAAEVLLLVRHLRWDAEEDLSRLVGDVAAHRLAGAARAFVAWQREALWRGAEGLMGYAAEDAGMVLARPDFAAHAHAVAELRDALERLAKRVERLAQAGTRRP